MAPKQLGILTFIVEFSFYSILINSSAHGWLAWYRIARHGVQTTATVLEVHPKIHQGCTFKNEANGKQLIGKEDGCSYAGINGQLPVNYLPDDPSFVTNRQPLPELLCMIFGPLLLSLFGGYPTAYQQMRKAR